MKLMFIKEFIELSSKDTHIAGGKGASLGEMIQAGFPVPPGFVILSNAFEEFIEENDLNVEIDSQLHKVAYKNIRTVEAASEVIQALILEKDIPKEITREIKRAFRSLNTKSVAVRSSATAEDSFHAAWAGQLESFLNTTEKDLMSNIKRCWASLFTPRAIFYRFEKDLHKQKISVAVVVEKMVESKKSGIAFSVHPVTQDSNQLIIEAGLGLGEAIVSGQITPDSYVVEKQPRRIIDKNIQIQTKGLYRAKNGGNEWHEISEEQGEKQALSDKEILELSEIVLRIENHYSLPCDIEWAFEKGKFYIVQSRPITTLNKSSEVEKEFNKNDYILSFWVQGVSVFVTDIHLEAYKELEVLYIIDDGMFKQYFTKEAYEHALDRGLKFYSDKHAFNNYQKELFAHCNTFRDFFESEVKDKKSLPKEVVAKFFKYTEKLCEDYAKMNFEFTDKAFSQQEKNPVIKKNLSGVAKFKDTIRAVMNMVLFEPNGYSNQFFGILGKQFGISPVIFDNLTQQEILALFDGKKPEENIVSKRQDAFVESYNLDGFYEGKDAERILQEFKEEAVHSEVIHGQVASKGNASGNVKIIPVDYSDLNRVNAEIEKMQKGDILVAETTAPELIVACKKAGAIVTDMGGLMSHAAIVSREFGIPCIVGTKNASKILKDGDRIEVDANNGLVRIIK